MRSCNTCSRYGWKQCSRCGASIAATELVMRVKELVYHIDCFTCIECNDRFTPGQQFALVGTSIYCRTHYHQMLSRATHSVSPGRSSSHSPANLEFKSRDFSSPQQHPPVSTYFESVASTTASVGKSRTSRKRKSPPAMMGAVPPEMTSYSGKSHHRSIVLDGSLNLLPQLRMFNAEILNA